MTMISRALRGVTYKTGAFARVKKAPPPCMDGWPPAAGARVSAVRTHAQNWAERAVFF